jgi:hypothetical protein
MTEAYEIIDHTYDVVIVGAGMRAALGMAASGSTQFQSGPEHGLLTNVRSVKPERRRAKPVEFRLPFRLPNALATSFVI